MQTDQLDDNTEQDDLPEFKPVPPPSDGSNMGESADAAASEAGDAHPVFGSAAQPQEIYDEELVGTKDDGEPGTGEDTVVNFDPENDVRMQDPPE